jgi:hypothetical protein|tara:strand:+ start:566 stop:892 length:327 start_codon:yes stop_codon:yes gene_type:complete
METDMKQAMDELKILQSLVRNKEWAIQKGIAAALGPQTFCQRCRSSVPTLGAALRVGGDGPVEDIKAYDIALGHWPCDTSPTGCCAYDSREDTMHDNCLFCDQPEERK